MLIEFKKKIKSRRNFLRSRGPCRPMDPGRFAKPSLQMKQRQLKLAPVTMTEVEFCKRPKNPQKSKKNGFKALKIMIRIVHPGSLIRMLTFSHPGSRIQGSKRHPIPDPQHW
jgi:hypothetical protein